MQRPDLESIPSFYRKYVAHVAEQTMLDALKSSHEQLKTIVKSIPETKGEFRYQPEKWSVKELLCHMMDAERIFCYRALRFARNDKTNLNGFDENSYAPEANAHSRTLDQLTEEMYRLRLTTIDLFASFNNQLLMRTGTANNTELSVLSLGYIVAGHETHHRIVLRERYLS